MKSHNIDEQGNHSIINRFGIDTISSGEMEIEYNVSIQNYVTKNISRKKLRTKMNKEIHELKKLKEETEMSRKMGKETDQILVQYSLFRASPGSSLQMSNRFEKQ